jgi:hypothetical protein
MSTRGVWTVSSKYHSPRVTQFRDVKSIRPYWQRAVNSIGNLAPQVAPADADRWIDRAVSKSGAHTDVDDEVREGARRLIESIREDSRLNLIGRLSLRDETLRLLGNHLGIKRALARRPDIETTAIPQPVFIIGLPRTGSTFLHTLMSNDLANRTIPYWESYTPVPPDSGPDRRPAAVDRMLKQMKIIAPDYPAIHPMSANAAEECVALFMNGFRTLQFDIQYRVPKYVEWLISQPADTAYQGYRQQLQIIWHFRPAGRRFVLKDPTHALHLRTVVETFPDAKFIFIHRAPEKTLSSICSLYAHTRAILSDDVDPVDIGQEVIDGYWPTALANMMKVRAALPNSQYTDIRQPDLNAHPVETLRHAYEALGFEMTEDAVHSMQRFLDEKLAEFKHPHEHRLEGFGLDTKEVRSQTRPYREQFDL